MKNKCRKGISKRVVLLMLAMLVLMSMLAACGTDGSRINSYYHLDVIEATPDFYVNDFAGVFSEQQKDELMEMAVAFDEEYSGIQVVITTVESLAGTVKDYEHVVEDAQGNKVENIQTQEPNGTPKFTIEQVAYSMYSQYGIGQDDMGILILFSTGDREVRIETGRAMQTYITDSVSGRLLDDYGMEYFVEDKFAEGLMSVQAATIDEIKAKVPVDWNATSEETQKSEFQNSESAAVGAVTGENQENTGGNVVTPEKNEEKDSGNGLLYGIFGAIMTAFAAIAAFIRQIFKGKSDKENLEKSKEEEINSLKADFFKQLDEKDRLHRRDVIRLESDYQHQINQKDAEIAILKEEFEDERRESRTLKNELEIVTDKYKRVQMLYPDHNFDAEVHEMIENEYKAAANEIDSKVAEVLAITADKDNYEVFNRALLLIDSADPEVRKYVACNRDEVQNLYDEAIRLRREFEKAEQEKRDKATAQEAYEKIQKVYEENPNGNHKSFEALHAALAIFFGLSAAEKAFFPDDNLIANLKRVHNSAEEDYEDFNAASEAEDQVRSVIGHMHSADEDDRDRLARAKRYYTNLTSSQKEYFSDELLRKLNRLIDAAEEDHRRENRRRAEEEEARRRREEQRRRNNSSSFSSPSRSSYSGHGGRPSGGGASRRF
ncbi:MAG: TPM domain-containing protein [Clostridia bacterium]|nr:TPM domain-containing protein [Clostridia bacterium]